MVHRFFPLIALAFFLFSACGTSKIDLSTRSPNQIPDIGPIVFEFSDEMVASEETGIWKDNDLVEITPPLKAKIRWFSKNSLDIIPDEEPAPNTDYVFKVKPIFNRDKSRKSAEKTFAFHTPRFDVVQADLFWDFEDNEEAALIPKINIHFNYPVNPKDIIPYLEVELNNNPISSLTFTETEVSNIIPIELPPIIQGEREQEIYIGVKKGAPCIYGEKGLPETHRKRMILPSFRDLTIRQIEPGLNEESGYIQIAASQSIKTPNLRDFIEITPAIDFTVSSTEASLLISGKFAPGSIYHIRIKKGLAGTAGGKLKEDFIKEVVFAEMNPTISFSGGKGRYMMRSGEKEIAGKAWSVGKVQLKVFKIYDNNLMAFLDRNRWDLFSGYNYRYVNVDDFGKLLYESTIEFPEISRSGNPFSLNLAQALKSEYKGVFLIEVRSAEDYWIRDYRLVAISDMGLIVKRTAEDFLVFANHIGTARSVSGAKISLISRTNQLISSGTTNESGLAILSNLSEKMKEFPPAMIFAEKDGEFTYLDLNDTRFETSRFDVSGRNPLHPKYDVFLYGDRDIYRPGETVKLAGIVRNMDRLVSARIPFKVKIQDSRGNRLGLFQVETNNQGAFEVSFSVPDFAPTGEYSATVTTGSDEQAGTYHFSIEEFVPDKLRVTLSPKDSIIGPGDMNEISIEAAYLFGASASGHSFDVFTSFREIPFSSKNFPKHDFSQNSLRFFNPGNHYDSGILNEDGQGILDVKTNSNLKSAGKIRATVHATVFEMSGRGVKNSTAFEIVTKDHFEGIALEDYYYATTQPIKTSLVALDKDGNCLNGYSGLLELVRFEWQTVLKKNYSGRFFYQSEKKEIKLWERPVNINGKAVEESFSVANSGQYELRFRKADDENYVYKTFYAYGWGVTTGNDFEIDREGRIEIVPSKTVYGPGESAKLLIKAPFTGKMLLTVEREKVLEHRWVDFSKNHQEVTITIQQQHLPNVYVTATLFRPHNQKENGQPFFVAHGIATLKVEKPDTRLALKIDAPETIKPGTKQKVKVSGPAGQTFHLTIAATDEGILQLTRYKSPDPHGFFYAKKPLSVISYDLYKYLLPEGLHQVSSAAGDEGYNPDGKRLNPIQAARFKPFSWWSGLMTTNSSGVATVEIDIPNINTEVRLMAVAWNNDRFGSATKAMKVADDLIMLPSIPRFLTVGDTLEMPVGLVNNTKQEANVEIALTTSGSATAVGSKTQKKTLKPGEMGFVKFQVAASDIPGKADIRLESSGLKAQGETVELAVRPASSLVTGGKSGELAAGTEITEKLPDYYLPGTEKAGVTISYFPALMFGNQLRDLLGYPHGCLEQTISRAFPQLYLDELARVVSPGMYQAKNAAYYVSEAVKKIEGMQMWDGSYSYWPGGGYQNRWSSVYAAHFLLEAKKAGHQVNEQGLERALSFIRKMTREKGTFSYRYHTENSILSQTKANKEIIYGLFVLALSGNPETATMNYYLARPNLLTHDTKYLLGGAFALNKQWSIFTNLLNEQFVTEPAMRENAGSFDSEIRANAIMLNVLAEIDPTNPQVVQLLNYFGRTVNRAFNTQETGMVFCGLGKLARRNAGSDLTVAVLINGKEAGKFTGKSKFIPISLPETGGELTIRPEGKGSAWFFLSHEGVRKDGKVELVDNQLSVRRTFYNQAGREIRDLVFSQNQLVVCKIEVRSLYRLLPNVAISDLIPAGMEIENPRIGETVSLSWIPEKRMEPDFLDIRDDRLIAFGTAPTTGTSFYYLLRAVNQGRFVLPPIGADAMYDPEVRSYSSPGKVTILSPGLKGI